MNKQYRRFRSWVRVVLPTEVLGVVVGLWALSYAVFGAAAMLGASGAWESHARTMSLAISLLAMGYASFRAAYFNPVEHTAYGRWLLESAWDDTKPLPLGPLQLAWQDAGVVGLLSVFATLIGYNFLWPPIIFLIVYALSLAYSLARIGMYRPGYAVVTMLGVLILLIPKPVWMFAASLAMAITASLAARELLRAFPYTREQRDKLRLTARRPETLSPAGWPVSPQMCEKYRWRISHVHALGVGLVMGWLTFCGLMHVPDIDELDALVRIACSFVVIPFVVVRLWLYVWGYLPPISLLGRIATARLIIPRYDVVFLAPLCAIATVVFLPVALHHTDLPMAVVNALSCGMAVWITLAFPPKREDWIYTGGYRLSPRLIALSEESNSSRRRRSFRLLQ